MKKEIAFIIGCIVAFGFLLWFGHYFAAGLVFMLIVGFWIGGK